MEADTFTGEPGFSAPVYETDYAPRKLRCDVLLNGSAYAPDGRPVDRVTVSFRVGTMRKSFDVVGDRVWQVIALSIGASAPKPFTKLPISYDRAFGGVDKSKGDPATFRWYPTNHAGVGWHDYLDTKFVDGSPVPNTEETGSRFGSRMGLIGRWLLVRSAGRGSPDRNGGEPTTRIGSTTRFPDCRKDFDERDFQASPEDQQTNYLTGGEEVELVNLTARGRTSFSIPRSDVPVRYESRREVKEAMPVLDTMILEPDLGRYSLVWRSQYPLHQDILEPAGYRWPHAAWLVSG